MDSPENSQQLIREHFSRLSGLPCWNVHQGYGSFVTFEFGKSSFRVRPPQRQSRFISRQEYDFEIHGDHHFWIEQCDWRIVARQTVLAVSNSNEKTISAALERFSGQILHGVRIRPEFGTCVFSFDMGLDFELYRYADFQSDDAMWSLYCPDVVISYLASGLIEYGSGEEAAPNSLRQRAT